MSGDGEACVGAIKASALIVGCGDGDGTGIRTGAGVKYSGNGMDAEELALGVDG